MKDKMAQSKVNDYFVARKNSKGTHQSKRRRIETNQTDDDISVVKRSLRSSNATTSIVNNDSETISKSIPDVVKVKCKQNTKQATSVRKRGRPTKTIVPDDQQLITLAFSPKESLILPESVPVLSKLTPTLINSQQEVAENTPTKKLIEEESSNVSRPRRRKDKIIEDVQSTPESVPAAKSKVKIVASVRKQLQLSSEEKAILENQKSTSEINSLLQNELLPKISPLPETPKSVSHQQTKGPELPSSPKVRAAIEKCKELQQASTKEKPSLEEKMQPENLKKQLKKCGKLEELKAHLLQMNKTIQKTKKTPKLKTFSEVRIPSPVKTTTASISSTKEVKVPAYEKYHSLASPPAPTLNLPLKYKKLAEIFRSMDTVVSMMHNRYEIITFSKLKNAVQIMNKKNFEMNHVGQVKTVHPAAYHFKQEKGLPMFGSKTSGYQLTIEANLSNDTLVEKNDKVKSERVNFSATHLLSRRNVFHTLLINRVKYHHKKFLKSLEKPLDIPDDKITRWHPAFMLDNVPDIEVSELPQPPVANKYHTAKDVLNERKGKLTAKVEEALEKVALEHDEKAKVKSEEKPTTVPDNAAYRGIPASLLEKIRAKEAKKLELVMTRDVEEEKKIYMMERLPDMIRIIRTLFVTEKKPALPEELVIKKLGDSTKSNIAVADVPKHLKLLVEILPEWMTVIDIKKGRYIKIDRNIDIHILSTKINNMVKAKK